MVIVGTVLNVPLKCVIALLNTHKNNMKLTNREWDKLTKEEKREAIINFQEPENIVTEEKYLNLTREKI